MAGIVIAITKAMIKTTYLERYMRVSKLLKNQLIKALTAHDDLLASKHLNRLNFIMGALNARHIANGLTEIPFNKHTLPMVKVEFQAYHAIKGF